MNTQFLKEAFKLAAYTFVTIGLAGTILTQAKVVQDSFKGVVR